MLNLLLLLKGGISVGQKVNYSTNGIWLSSHLEKIKFYLYPTLNIMINSKCIQDLNVKKNEIIKLLEENIGEFIILI